MYHEARRLVEGHVAHHGLLDPNAGLVQRHGGHIDDCTRLIPLGLPLVLVGLVRDAAACAEHETGIHLDVFVGVVGLTVAQFVEHIHRHLQHLVIHGVVLLVVILADGVLSVAGAIDIHVEARLGRGRQREAYLLCLRLVLAALVAEIETENGCKLNLICTSCDCRLQIQCAIGIISLSDSGVFSQLRDFLDRFPCP